MQLSSFLPLLGQMSLCGSLVILPVLALRWALRRGPKAPVYALWGLVLFRLLCPVSVTSALSVFNLLSPGSLAPPVSAAPQNAAGADGANAQVPDAAASHTATPAPTRDTATDGVGTGPAGTDTGALPQNGQAPAPPDGAPAALPNGTGTDSTGTDSTGTDSTGADSTDTNDTATGAADSAAAAPPNGADSAGGDGTPHAPTGTAPTPDTLADPFASGQAARVVTAVWLAGVAEMLLGAGVRLLRLRRLLAAAVPCGKGVFLADYIDTAFVLGVLRPRIYLPSALSQLQRALVLRHERCHIRRLDHISRLAAFAALCLHWFNPLVWLAFALSGKDMELACDEAVLRRTPGDIRALYARALLQFSTKHDEIGGMSPAFGEGDTKTRVKNIMRYRRPAAWRLALAVALCLTLAACTVTDPVRTGDGQGSGGTFWQQPLGGAPAQDGDLPTAATPAPGAKSDLEQMVELSFPDWDLPQDTLAGTLVAQRLNELYVQEDYRAKFAALPVYTLHGLNVGPTPLDGQAVLEDDALYLRYGADYDIRRYDLRPVWQDAQRTIYLGSAWSETPGGLVVVQDADGALTEGFLFDDTDLCDARWEDSPADAQPAGVALSYERLSDDGQVLTRFSNASDVTITVDLAARTVSWHYDPQPANIHTQYAATADGAWQLCGSGTGATSAGAQNVVLYNTQSGQAQWLACTFCAGDDIGFFRNGDLYVRTQHKLTLRGAADGYSQPLPFEMNSFFAPGAASPERRVLHGIYRDPDNGNFLVLFHRTTPLQEQAIHSVADTNVCYQLAYCDADGNWLGTLATDLPVRPGPDGYAATRLWLQDGAVHVEVEAADGTDSYTAALTALTGPQRLPVPAPGAERRYDPAAPLWQRVLPSTQDPQATPTALYAQPDAAAEVLDTLVPDRSATFFVLEVEGDWAQVAYLGQLGWCPLRALRLGDTPLALPDFLDEEQLRGYLQGLSLYHQLFGNSGLCDYGDAVTVPRQSIAGYPSQGTFYRALYCQGRYDRAARLLQQLYAPPLLETMLERYVDVDGALYELEGDMGFFAEIFDITFRLDSQQEDSVVFTCVVQAGNVEQDETGQAFLREAPTTHQLPVYLVKGQDGAWRAAMIADPYTLRSSLSG